MARRTQRSLIACCAFLALFSLPPCDAFNEEFFTVLSKHDPMVVPYSREDKETLEAPPVYQHDPRTRRQLVEMLRHSPYSDDDWAYIMGESAGADSFLRRAWSSMRRSLGAGRREPTRPFAKRNLFARLAPIPVFMITDWQGEPKFFEPEDEFEPMFCPIFFDHADAEALMYELYTEDPSSYDPLDEEELRLLAVSLDEALIMSSRYHEQQAREDMQRGERPIDIFFGKLKDLFWMCVPEPFLPKSEKRSWEEVRQEFLDEVFDDELDDDEEEEASASVEPTGKAMLKVLETRGLQKALPKGSFLRRWLVPKEDEEMDTRDLYYKYAMKFAKEQKLGNPFRVEDSDDDDDDDDEDEEDDEGEDQGGDEDESENDEDDEVFVYEFIPSTRQYIKGKINRVKLATPDAFDSLPLYFVEGMQIRHGFRKLLPYYMSYDDCVNKYNEARQRALRRGADVSQWPEKAPVQADNFRNVALAIDTGSVDYTIVPDSKQLEFIRRNIGKDQLARLHPISQEDR